MNINIFALRTIKPLAQIGLTHPFWEINIDTMINTWAALTFLVVVSMLCIFTVRHFPKSAACFLVKKGFYSLKNLNIETIGYLKQDCFIFTTTVFLFIVSCAFTGLIPSLGEATSDINTALALGISCFVFIQIQGIKAHGLSHFKEYIRPFFLLLPLNIIGESAKAASMSFRLFGNILGGTIILHLLHSLIANYYFPFWIMTSVILGCGAIHRFFVLNGRSRYFDKLISFGNVLLFFPIYVQVLFGVMEGILQAFVICMLTLTYVSLAVKNET